MTRHIQLNIPKIIISTMVSVGFTLLITSALISFPLKFDDQWPFNPTENQIFSYFPNMVC
jgi:hypothetical protein